MAPPEAVADRMYLVCEHKTNGRNLLPDGLSILDEAGLVMIVSANPDIKIIRKAIEPGCTSVDIYKHDLVPEDQKAAFMENTQGAEVPWKEFLGHAFEGHSFDELVLLVPETAVPQLDEMKDRTTDGTSAET